MVRYHQMRVSGATIYRTLKRHGVKHLPDKPGRRKFYTKRYNKQVPGHHSQMDIKYLMFKGKTAESSNVTNTLQSMIPRVLEH